MVIAPAKFENHTGQERRMPSNRIETERAYLRTFAFDVCDAVEHGTSDNVPRLVLIFHSPNA